MADQKVSQLTDADTPLSGEELVYVVQSGAQRKATTQDIADLAPAVSAAGVSYDPSESGLSAGNVQDAIDELAASSGGGLVRFTENYSNTAPNNVTTAVQLIATDASASNVDAVFSSKGSGAVLAQIPDGSTSSGNKRGANATDFQVSRTSAVQVASGTNSGILCGTSNTANNNNAGVLAGTSNTASGTNCGVLCGSSNTASGIGASAVVAGQSNNASGQRAVIGGGLSSTASGTNCGVFSGLSNTASGTQSFVGAGESNTASGESSWIPGGEHGLTRGLFSAYAWSGARRATQGDNQCIGLPVQAQTTDATTTTLTANRGSAGPANVMVLPNNSCWAGQVHITGRSTAGDVAHRRIDVVATRGAGAGTTAIAAQTTDYSFTAAGLAGVVISVVAETTQGGPVVQVNGLAATTIDWFAHFDAGNQIVR